MTESPFALERFEHQRRHLYYLPPKIFDILEAPKSTILIGSRGTGKTTLLNALSWKEQTSNPDLAARIRSHEQNYVGLYLRMPEYQASALNTWLSSFDPLLGATIFAFYIDLIWLEDLANILAALLIKRDLKAAPRREYELVGSILGRFPALLIDFSFESPVGLKRLSSVFVSNRRRLEAMALAKAQIAAEEILGRFPVAGGIGEFGRNVASLCAEFCDRFGRPGRTWHFKLCLDESECLSPSQQIVLNTLMRLVKYPVSLVVSYVRPIDDMTTTFAPAMTLQAADREIVNLDTMPETDFNALCEGVAGVRCEKIAGKSPIEFNTKKVLGTLDLNSLLQGVLSSSESAKAKDLLEEAQNLENSGLFAPRGKQTKDENAPPPIYQAFIIKTLGIQIPSNPKSWQRRAQASREIRKRMVAAYLLICNEFNTDPRYAFAEMVFQMSDRCVRDYLAQMDEIFKEAAVDIESFVTRQVGWAIQNKALHQASRQKREYLPRSGVGAPSRTLQLIDSLGQLTALLQSSPDRERALRSSERGIFILEIPHQSAQIEALLKLILDASEAGFLRIREQSASKLIFRVHCSLAAVYGFSYRGAYYNSALSIQDLLRLSQTIDETERGNAVKEIAQGMIQNQQELGFEDEGEL
jgi:Cdc6-like AAA superfamily ATPase